jgi:2-aminoadipate transaminase
VTLPEGLDMQAIFKSALEQNVAFVPGDSFYANVGHNNVGRNDAHRNHDGRNQDGYNSGREGSRHMRLNFSNAAPDEIREGIRRLSMALKSHLPASARPPQVEVEPSRA